MSFLSKLFGRKPRVQQHLNLVIRKGDECLMIPLPYSLRGSIEAGSYVASVVTDEEARKLRTGHELLVSIAHPDVNCNKRIKANTANITHRVVAPPQSLNEFQATPPQTPYPTGVFSLNKE